jgi:hypothetical protein
MRRVVALLMCCAAGIVALGGVASARIGKPVDACPFVTLAYASGLLGDRTARVNPTDGRDCLYAAAPATAGGTTQTVLVQVSRWARSPAVPQFASAVRVPGARHCWSVQLQGMEVACYQRGRFIGVTATGTPDDLATATAAMQTAVANLNPAKR